jgi:hypothetical protein
MNRTASFPIRLPQISPLDSRTRSGRGEPCRTSRRSRYRVGLVLEDLAQGEHERLGENIALAWDSARAGVRVFDLTSIMAVDYSTEQLRQGAPAGVGTLGINFGPKSLRRGLVSATD